MIKKLFLIIMLLSFACTCFATHFSAPTDVYYLKDYNNKLFFTANTPVSNFSGTVDIEYTIADAFGNNSNAKATVTVNPAIVVLKPKPVSSGGALNMYLFTLLWGIVLIRLQLRKGNNF